MADPIAAPPVVNCAAAEMAPRSWIAPCRRWPAPAADAGQASIKRVLAVAHRPRFDASGSIHG